MSPTDAKVGGGDSGSPETSSTSGWTTEGPIVTIVSQGPGQFETQLVYTNPPGVTSTMTLPSIPIKDSPSTVTFGTAAIQLIYPSGDNKGTPSLSAAVVSITSPPATESTKPATASSTNSTTNTGSSADSTALGGSDRGNSTNSDNSGNSNNVSPGEAAGIGIGAAIGGILLASAIFFLCFRKSTRRKPRYDTEIPLKRSPSYGENKAPGLSQVTAIGTWNSSAEKHLPQPVPDDTISGEMSKLHSLINNHVQSYYRTSEIDVDAIDQTTLAGLVDNPQITSSALASAITNPKKRTPALRYLIAWTIFSRIGLQSHPGTTFLPLEVVSCLDSMTGLQEDEKARNALLSKWRIITATMLQPTYGSKTITDGDPRAHNIGVALDDLDSVLTRLRARRDENSQRRRNLEEILKRAASFAFVLFSHPSSWTFDWQANHTYEADSVVIFPALLQVTDESGQRHSRPRTFEEMVVEPRLIA